MTQRFETRRDFREAGRAMAEEAAATFAAHILTVAGQSPKDLTDKYIEDAAHKLVRMADEVSRTHFDNGAPAAWVLKFRNAFLVTASARLREMSEAVEQLTSQTRH
jgi:hypothetical protein